MKNDLGELKREWNELASMDALWAINSRRDKKYSKWTVEEFLDTGRVEVKTVMSQAARLGRPRAHRTALDFGCGVGRLSGHLATYFEHVQGVDISEEMVEIGRQIHPNARNLEFTVNVDPDLRNFAAESFDMVCSIIVLQHLPGAAAIERYLIEFVRLLRPDGLLVFQLPTALPKTRLLLARRTPYLALRRLGLPPEFLYFHLGLHPMRMTALPANRAIRCIREAGGRMIDVVSAGKHNNIYYATRWRGAVRVLTIYLNNYISKLFAKTHVYISLLKGETCLVVWLSPRKAVPETRMRIGTSWTRSIGLLMPFLQPRCRLWVHKRPLGNKRT